MAVVLAAAAAGIAEAEDLPAGVEIAGGDGTSCDEAVIIRAPGTVAGVQAESIWLRRHYPGSTKLRQALTRCGDQIADQITIRTAEGSELTVFFDISDFFGKY